MTAREKKARPKYFCQLCGWHDESTETHMLSKSHRAAKQMIEDAMNAAPLRARVVEEERWPSKG